MRRRPLLLCACVFVLGLLYGKQSGWYLPIFVCIIAIYAILPFLTMHFYRKGVWRCLWIGAAFAIGILHMRSQTAFRSAELTQIYEGETISLCGEIYKKEIKNDQLLVYLKNCYAVSNEEQLSCNQVLLYQTSDEFSIGDILFVNGKVNMFQSASNEGAFDAQSYYFSQKIDFAMRNAEVSLLEPAQSPVEEALWHLRQRVADIYTEASDAITAGVLSVMILGEKSTLDSEVKELYQSMGISHILAISGLHVSMIGLGIYRFLRRRGIRYSYAFALSGGLLFLYALLTGASVSTKRAVGMLGLLMLADVWGRAYDSLNALGAMILYLLWENPFLLEYAGFTLSVAAVLGVSTIGTAMQVKEKEEKPDMTRVELEEDSGVPEEAEKGCGKLRGDVQERTQTKSGTKKPEETLRRPGRTKECLQGKRCRKGKEEPGNRKNYVHKLINAAYMGVGIWLFTLPLVALYYYEIPLYSALLNLFVVPLLKYLILLGAAGALVGVVGAGMIAGDISGISDTGMIVGAESGISGAGRIAGAESGIIGTESCIPTGIQNIVSLILLPCRWILNWYDTAANVCLNLPLARIIVGKPSWSRIFIYYAAIAFLTIIWTKRKEKHWIRLAGSVVILTILLTPTSREFEVDVLDVGQGDGTYICSKEGVPLFIDGGSTNVSSVGTYRILPFLKSKGIRRVSYWFVSHADADHISGLLEVIESGYTIDNLILANRTVQDDSRDNLIEVAQAAGTNVICMKTGDVLNLGGTKIICLSPAADNRYEDRNDGGLVLLYMDDQFSAMFAGDIPGEVEDTIVAEYEQDTGLEEQKSLLDVDYYKVNHHGSKYSSGKLWLEALTPEVTTISCSSTNTYGHPHQETLERLSEAGTEIYRTDELGAIRITLEGGEISVSGYNSP